MLKLHAPPLKIESSHLRCKAANKCVNVTELSKIVKRNEDRQCLRKDTQVEKKLNYCEIFAPKLHLHLKLWFYNLIAFNIPSQLSENTCY